MRIPILYQDADLMIVDKPVGIATHAPADDPYPADAIAILRRQMGVNYLGMHQRLDKEASGVLLFSLRPEVNPALARVFERHGVGKVYQAIVHGAPRAASGLVDAPIVRERGDRYRVTTPDDPRGQPARTRWRRLAVSPDRRFSLLEVIPETGRTHQIRVHLAHIGLPVVGDVQYDPQRRPAPRLMLHALSLTLPHPATDQPMTITAPTLAIFRRVAEGLPELEPLDWNKGAALRNRLSLIVQRRAPLAADPETTAYRLVHGAADGLEGITVDRFGDVLMVNLYDEFPPRSQQALITALADVCQPQAIYVKQRPPETSRITEEEIARLASPTPTWGEPCDQVTVLEDGLRYVIRPGAGLNVGLFLDMREMRGRVRAWAAGKTVLNCFAYTCGFGVAAIAGGASCVLNLDLSRSALAWGQENYRANGFVPDDYDFVYGDVFDWLGRFARRSQTFDIVIVDPPGFARAHGRPFSAVRHYARLAEMAARVVSTGGLLIACCNVAALARRDFRHQVEEGITAAGRAAEVVGLFSEPAVDFPVLPGEAPYLKLLVMRLA